MTDSLVPVHAFIGVGANLGDPVLQVCEALKAMQQWSHSQLLRCSSLYRTAPVDSSGPDYINAVVMLQTTLPALTLLHVLQELETQAGRERPWRNAPRTLDLDILLYGGCVLHTKELVLPHPRMYERAFVLVPLAEIAPQEVPEQCLRAVQTQAIECMGQAPGQYGLCKTL